MKFELRFVNGLLLALVLFLSLSGVYGLYWTYSEWMFALHRAAGWGLLALLPWKGLIIYRSLRRRLGKASSLREGGVLAVSLLLAVVTITVLGLGLLWKGRFGPQEYWLRQTAVSWHWMLALGVLVPLALHAWQRWPRPQRADFVTRRAALRFLLITPVAAAGYLAYASLSRARALADQPVRHTGSRRQGFYSGNAFPVTHNLAPQAGQIDPARWRLDVGGAVRQSLQFDYPALQTLPTAEQDVIIDCTLGWYSIQTWRGIPLKDLLEQAGLRGSPAGVRLVSVTGYAQILPWQEAQQILLATHVSGETLAAEHGFPLRAVVPTRRGWFWVKWLTKIEVIDVF